MAIKVLVKDGKLATYGGKVVKVEATGAEAIEPDPSESGRYAPHQGRKPLCVE